MAYLDSEIRNARLIWSTISDKVLIIGLIAFAMGAASVILSLYGVAPSAM